MDPNTTSLLATGIYGVVNTLSTLPAVFFLDRIGRRPLLMMGAVGCCFSLVVVGSLIAAFGKDWPNHKAAGNAAIAFVFVYDFWFSLSWAPIGYVLFPALHAISRADEGQMGPPQRDLQLGDQEYRCFDHYQHYLDVQLHHWCRQSPHAREHSQRRNVLLLCRLCHSWFLHCL